MDEIERFIPGMAGPIWYEHWHRYHFVAPIAAGKVVVDAACGEGYGSALLARHAARVTGVDVSAAIVAQSSDGTLVVGDSHHYAATPDGARSGDVDDLILGELRALLGIAPRVIDRWLGFYPVVEGGRPVLAEAIAPRVRLVVTSGTGMSTAFAIGEETVAALFG